MRRGSAPHGFLRRSGAGWALLVLWAAAACGEATRLPVDAAPDAQPRDAGPPADAGLAGDAAAPDASRFDGGALDATAPDAGATDAGAGRIDAGQDDAGHPTDAGAPDAELEADASAPDAGGPDDADPADTGVADGGADAGAPDGGAVEADGGTGAAVRIDRAVAYLNLQPIVSPDPLVVILDLGFSNPGAQPVTVTFGQATLTGAFSSTFVIEDAQGSTAHTAPPGASTNTFRKVPRSGPALTNPQAYCNSNATLALSVAGAPPVSTPVTVGCVR